MHEIARGLMVPAPRLHRLIPELAPAPKASRRADGAGQGPGESPAEVKRQLLVKVMVAICIADGEVGDDEIAMISRVHDQLVGYELDLDEVRLYAEAVMAHGAPPISQTIAAAAGILSPGDCDLLIRAAWVIIAADGVARPEEAAVFSQIQEALGLEAGHVQRLIQETKEGRGQS
jgi:uncharacterized tellurite resistance protein B-like protein